MVNLIEGHGFKATGYASARAFLESLAACRAACLITDIRMPDMDGFDLMETLKRSRPPIPIIVITALPEEDVHLRALRKGAMVCLHKPVREEALIEWLDRAAGL